VIGLNSTTFLVQGEDVLSRKTVNDCDFPRRAYIELRPSFGAKPTNSVKLRDCKAGARIKPLESIWHQCSTRG